MKLYRQMNSTILFSIILESIKLHWITNDIMGEMNGRNSFMGKKSPFYSFQIFSHRHQLVFDWAKYP